jgi:hypothetical protein
LSCILFITSLCKGFSHFGGAQKKFEVCPPFNSFLRPPLSIAYIYLRKTQSRVIHLTTELKTTESIKINCKDSLQMHDPAKCKYMYENKHLLHTYISSLIYYKSNKNLRREIKGVPNNQNTTIPLFVIHVQKVWRD